MLDECIAACSEKVELLFEHLHRQDQDAALEVVASMPKVAWIQDEKSGGYAIHIACWKVSKFLLLTTLVIPAYARLGIDGAVHSK